MSPSSSLAEIARVTNTGGEQLGDVVWWMLSGATVARADLERVWNANALDPSLLPPEPTPEKALTTACKLAATGQKERLIRRTKESDAEMIFAVVHEHKDSAGNASYVQECLAHLDRKTKTLSERAGGAAPHPTFEKINAEFNVYRSTHTSDDVRVAILKALGTMAAVALRDSGGIYWVPAVHAAKLRQLQAAIEALGSSRVYLLPVARSAEAERTLADVAKGSLESELTELQTEIAAFVETPPDRASTLGRRLEAFAALKARAELYRSVLSVNVSDLGEQIATLTTTVETMLIQKEAAR